MSLLHQRHASTLKFDNLTNFVCFIFFGYTDSYYSRDSIVQLIFTNSLTYRPYLLQSQRGHEIYLPASFYTHARYISIKGWRYISDPLYSIRYPLGALRMGHGLHNCHTVLVRLYVNIYLIVPDKGTIVSWGDKQRPDTFKKISTRNFIFSKK